jgi:hypothetical protein
MRKILLLFTVMVITRSIFAQWENNTTPTYPEVIDQCRLWDNAHAEIELYAMGASDYGLPIYLFIINGAGDSIQTFEKAKTSTTILVNNAIHAGEPDGVNAMLIWTKDWIAKGKKTKDMPVIAFIPAYSVGGMMTRSSTSRANQNGPEEYGFRGNAQNLDLNRDFIKMDSRNAFTFAKIFHGLNPDVFMDNHVTNGADYQHVLTLISPLKERLAPSMEDQTYCKMIPNLRKELEKKGIDMVPYVDMIKEIPDDGLQAFNDLPRYAMGYASLFNTFSFTVETHMLKPFPERVKATNDFFQAMLDYCMKEGEAIEKARKEAQIFQEGEAYHYFNFDLDKSVVDSITFSGFEAKYKTSEVTGLPRLYYDRNSPWTRKIPFYQTHVAKDSIALPKYYVVGGQAQNVIDRLKANAIEMTEVKVEQFIEADLQRIISFKSPNQPYENHFLHSSTEVELVTKQVKLKAGDYIIPAQQKNSFFLQSVLFAQTEDSYFAWNFFDAYMGQKEYFSPYVFEDIAADILRKDENLKTEFLAKKAEDPNFAKSQWDQLFFIYQRSDYFEPSFRVIPVYLVY